MNGAYPHLRVKTKGGVTHDIPVGIGDAVSFNFDVTVVEIVYKPHRESCILMDQSEMVTIESAEGR